MPSRKRRRRTGNQPAEPLPDILYHGCHVSRAERFQRRGYVDARHGRQVFLSTAEDEAWRVAHRFRQHPMVLYVDAGRAHRSGVRFKRVRNGLWVASRIPCRHVLNLRRGFAEQLSAGGLLLREDRGEPELALIACTRRTRTTWEIAKGKTEPGESPEQTAIRELQEEMGFTAGIDILEDLGVVRYGFRTPEGHPRLKTLFVYLMRAEVPPEEFSPSVREGIGEVRWFGVDEACRRVTHTSLIPLMKRVRAVVGAR